MREDAAMLVVVGRIGRGHGVRGEVSVELRTDEPEARFAVGASLHTDGPRKLTIRSVRPHLGRLLIAFDEVVDRERAETLRGATLSAEVEAHERPDDPEEYYDRQLVGLEVHAAESGAVGQVVGVVHLPLQDLLTIRRTDGREVMVPFVAELVPEVDLVAGTLRVADRPGLLHPDDDRAAELPVPGDG
jgi:16S rRNA processing protein RimM